MPSGGFTPCWGQRVADGLAGAGAGLKDKNAARNRHDPRTLHRRRPKRRGPPDRSDILATIVSRKQSPTQVSVPPSSPSPGPQPGGLPDGSRGLSNAIPPDPGRPAPCTPEGCQRRTISPVGFWHPSGVRSALFAFPGVSLRATPGYRLPPPPGVRAPARHPPLRIRHRPGARGICPSESPGETGGAVPRGNVWPSASDGGPRNPENTGFNHRWRFRNPIKIPPKCELGTIPGRRRREAATRGGGPGGHGENYAHGRHANQGSAR